MAFSNYTTRTTTNSQQQYTQHHQQQQQHWPLWPQRQRRLLPFVVLELNVFVAFITFPPGFLCFDSKTRTTKVSLVGLRQESARGSSSYSAGEVATVPLLLLHRKQPQLAEVPLPSPNKAAAEQPGNQTHAFFLSLCNAGFCRRLYLLLENFIKNIYIFGKKSPKNYECPNKNNLKLE